MALLDAKPVTARKVGDNLVATFVRATPPVIWRFDLARNHSFTLTLQGEEGEWELGIASPKGEFHPIAKFAMREEADESFAALSDIIGRERRVWWSYFVSGLGFGFSAMLLVALVFGLLYLRQGYVANHPVPTQAGSPVPAATETAPADGNQLQQGVPHAADDVLTPPP